MMKLAGILLGVCIVGTVFALIQRYVPNPIRPAVVASPSDWKDALKMLSASGQVEVLSLDPDRYAKDGTFHGYRVLGTTVLTTAQRDRIHASLHDSLGEKGSKCFSPRHGLRIMDGHNVAELVICFECGWVYVYFSNGRSDRVGIRRPRDPAAFNEVLKAAGQRLAPV